MCKLLGSALAVASLTALASPVSGQRAPASAVRTPGHELGVDLAAQYSNQGDGIGGGLQMVSPVDVRVAFLSHSRFMLEPRLAFALDTKGTGTSTAYTFTPGLNVLYPLKQEAGMRRMLVPYVTGGVQLAFVRGGVNNFTSSGTQFALDGGVGTRVPFGGSAVRFEGYLSYAFQTNVLPRMFAVGTRVGMSFWR